MTSLVQQHLDVRTDEAASSKLMNFHQTTTVFLFMALQAIQSMTCCGLQPKRYITLNKSLFPENWWHILAVVGKTTILTFLLQLTEIKLIHLHVLNSDFCHITSWFVLELDMQFWEAQDISKQFRAQHYSTEPIPQIWMLVTKNFLL